jgi:hypothetical protein
MTSLLCFPSVYVVYMVIKKMLLKRQQFSENKLRLYSFLHSNTEYSKHMLQSD